jgi:hypothetical protein
MSENTAVEYCLFSRASFILGTIPCAMLGGIPVTTAWRILGLWMDEQPSVMEVSCEEYIE